MLLSCIHTLMRASSNAMLILHEYRHLSQYMPNRPVCYLRSLTMLHATIAGQSLSACDSQCSSSYGPLTYIHSCAMTNPADPADPALTSKPAHTCSPTIVTACMQNLLSQSHHRMCLHLIRLKMSQFSHVWGPPAPPPCMTCMSLAWPVRQHACSHCVKLQSRRASGSSAIAHSKS